MRRQSENPCHEPTSRIRASPSLHHQESHHTPITALKSHLADGFDYIKMSEQATRMMFVITGNSPQKVLRSASKLRSWASAQSESDIDLAGLAYTLAARRSMCQWRHALQAKSLRELLVQLHETWVPSKSSKAHRVLYVFTGQGAQWHAMGRELNLRYPVYRKSILRSDKILQELGTSWHLVQELDRNELDSRVHQSEIAQPSSTALQIALVDLLSSLGVRPGTVIGHSSGEIAAAYAAGVISQETALKISFTRSLLSKVCEQNYSSKGAMLSIGLGEREISALLLEERNGEISLACVNSPMSTTVSGDESAILDLQRRLNDLGLFNRKLKVDTAYHSQRMRSVAHDYHRSLDTLETKTIQDDITFISSVTGKQKINGFNPGYWVENLVSKVHFSDALEAYCNLELNSSHGKGAQHLVIEVGPHGALAGPIQQTMTEARDLLIYSYHSVLTRGIDARQSILSLSGRLFEQGFPVDIDAANSSLNLKSSCRVLPDLPTCPWDHSTIYWHESRLSRDHRTRRRPYHDLLGIKIVSSTSLEPTWRYILNLDSLPWLVDHVIDGLVTFPGAGYVCMAIEAAKQLAQDKGFSVERFVLRRIRFIKALVIPPSPKSIELQLCFRPQQLNQELWEEFRIYALSENDIWYEHCRGGIATIPASGPRPGDTSSNEPELQDVHLTGSQTLTASEIYGRLHVDGNSYGPCFACIKEIEIAVSSAVSSITIPDIESKMPARYQQPHIIHPTTLDALLHTAVPLCSRQYGSGAVMPISIEELSISVQISSMPGAVLFATVDSYPNGGRSASVNLSVSSKKTTAAEQSLLMASNIQLLGVGDSKRKSSIFAGRRDMAFQMQWMPEIGSTIGGSMVTGPNVRCQAEVNDYERLNGSREEYCKVTDISRPPEQSINLIVAYGCENFAEVLTALLQEDNHRVSAITWASQAISEQASYVILDNCESPFLESPSTALFQQITRIINSVSDITWVSAQPRFVDPSSIRDPKSALVTGLARSARAEREQLRFTTLDIPEDITKALPAVSHAVAQVFRRSLNGGDEMEYAYRKGQLFIPRLVSDAYLNERIAQAGKPQLDYELYSQSKYPLKLDVDSIESQGELCFVYDDLAQGLQKSREVEVEALAHPLDTRHTHGIEKLRTDLAPSIYAFVGRIRSIGSEAHTTIDIGDIVMGWNFQGPAYVSLPRTDACNITRVPSTWSLSVAAAETIPLMAAYHSLIEIAKLGEGQSVLIHGTAGIYGQIAIAMAKSIGAKVFATLSTSARRRDFAARFALPASHFLFDNIFGLREEILKLTDRKGVDVVVVMPCEGSVSHLEGCMAALGLYVYVLRPGGDRNATQTSFARPGATFVSLDMDMLAQHRPQKLAYNLGKAVSMLPNAFAPIADVKCTDLSRIEEALVDSQKATAPEMLVFTTDEDTKVKVRVRGGLQSGSGVGRCNLRQDATYVIAGGLGDVGQKFSTILAQNGANYIVLLSRRSLPQETADLLQNKLRQDSPDLRLYVMRCDISKRSSVMRVAASVEQLELPPVRGVLQSATVLHDQVLETMTAEDWKLPLRTKMHGTRNLDEAFASSSLDFFIMLSSMSGVMGTRGQANYAAGNTYQDAFAQCRADLQTAYIAIDLGLLEDGSVYHDKAGQVKLQSLLRQGFIPIKSEQLITILEWSLSADTWKRTSRQFAVGMDDKSIHQAENATPTSKSAMFTNLQVADTVGEPADYAYTLSHKARVAAADTPEEAQKVILGTLGHKVSSLVSVSKEDVDHDKSLQDLGLDSLTAIELKSFIRKEFEATVHASEILDEPCLTALSTKVIARSEVWRAKFGHSQEVTKNKVMLKRQFASFDGISNGSRQIREENTLPALPLPSIESTMDLYLTSVEPFLDAQTIKSTSETVRSFIEGPGSLLQQKLAIRHKSREIENWQSDLQVSGVYLRQRKPIHPLGTFYGVHSLIDRIHSQAERAAIIAETAYTFKQKLEANELEPDYLNEELLCSRSLNWLFNACREPRRSVDKTVKHERNNYVVVLRRGHAFKILLEHNSHPVSRAKLRDAFEKTLSLSSQMLPSVATLTADERDSWAVLRDIICTVDPANCKALKTVESAAFIVCLEDSSPTTPTERCNALLLGDPGNRWSDKTLQFVVCANGISGYICEHSMIDAASLRQINDSITTAIINTSAQSDYESTYHDCSSVLNELTFSTNTVLEENIDRVHSHVSSTVNPVETAHFELPSVGNTFFRGHKIPSKSAIQAVIQLASLLYYGMQYPSWETLTTMLFRSGRVDWIQSVSPAMMKFCKTAFDDEFSLAQRSQMLREAIGTHASTMTRISRGRGFAAHLEALREVAQQEEAMPDFFDDPTWGMMSVTSSRKLKTDASRGMRTQEAGFYMPDVESVFLHYEMNEGDCRIFVQTTENRTHRFCEALKQAAQQTLRLLQDPL